jgi:hypothetical protein
VVSVCAAQSVEVAEIAGVLKYYADSLGGAGAGAQGEAEKAEALAAKEEAESIRALAATFAS